MKVITRKANALIAAERWVSQYKSNYHGDDKAIIAKKLKGLGDNPKADDVDKIIGNQSWTRVGSCDECGKKARKLIQVGEEADYDSSTARICKKCLEKAIKL